MDQLAELVSNGMSIREAGELLGYSPTVASSTFEKIKKRLGKEQCR